MALRLLHLSTDDIRGGAARCAHRLHTAMLRSGAESRMLVLRRSGHDPEVLSFRPAPGIPARLRRRIRAWRIAREHAPYEAARPAGLEPFTDDRTPFGGGIAARLPPCDIVHLHWVSNFVDVPRFLQALPRRVPVVWTLHDMRVLTGGCHYDLGCGRFEDRCGRCPQLGSERDDDLSRRIWMRQADALRRVSAQRLCVVGPSRWMGAAIERSSLFGGRFPARVIATGLDTAAFAPRDRTAARDALGIPPDSRVVAFAPHSVQNRRKGLDLLAEALRRISDVPELLLLALGTGALPEDVAVPHLHLGYLAEERLVSLVLSAADVHVLPSRQDNLPNTVMEAMACGVPTAAFDVGGVPDLVRPGETGALAPPGDPEGLAAAIRTLLLAPAEERGRISRRCREIAVAEYGLDVLAHAYADLYRERLDALAEDPAVRNGEPEPREDAVARRSRALA